MTEFTVESATGIKLPGPVVFEPDSDKLSAVSDAALDLVHDYLDANPDVTLLRIEAHTDDGGTPDGNWVLSQKRAMNVARGLLGRPYIWGGYGLGAEGLDCSGFVSTVLSAVGLMP